jgi:hypothetical protein
MKYIKLFLLSTLVACPNQIPEQPKPIIFENDYCYKAEYNLNKLNCREGKPTKTGVTFTSFCLKTQENGIPLRPKCLSEIDSCEKIDECTKSK